MQTLKKVGPPKGDGIKIKKKTGSSKMVKDSPLKGLSSLKLSRHTGVSVLEQCKLVSNLRALVEHKEAIPVFKGRDYPTSLTIPHSGYQLTDTKESLVLRSTIRSLFTDREYKFRISTALNMSSSAAGIINSTISNTVLTANTDFIALSSVFDEYFVHSYTCDWQPVSRYGYLLTGTNTSVKNLPMGIASLQHGMVPYTNLAEMTQNYSFRYHNTGDPCVVSWVNVEDPKKESTVVSLTAPTQSWCPVNNSANYRGSLQFLTQSAPPALPFSQVAGTFATHFIVSFRVRV